jgi:hypothetical protein
MVFRMRCFGPIALLAVSTVSLALNQKSATPQESVWFVLLEEFGSNGKLILDRLATVSEGALSRVPANCSEDDPASKQFSATYLNAGHSYSVLFGGSAAGSVVVRARDKEPVDAVDYRGPARIRGQVMALATNAVISYVGATSRQAPTAAERQAASKLAENLFANVGVPADLLAKIKVGNVTHTILLPSKSPSLIGSFSIEAGGGRRPTHNLLFIATFNGIYYVPELVWTKTSINEVESESAKFVDQSDLLGDGEEEVIVFEQGYEGYGYRIYRRTRNDASHWESIFEADGPGC